MRTVIFRYKNILSIILFVCIIPFTGCSNQAVEEKQVIVIFRFDDYSARSSTDIELRIIDAFRKNKASITFGVIPFICASSVLDPSTQAVVSLTSMKGDILKNARKAGIVDIALHGYSHQTINSHQRTEFSGVDYNVQVEKLAQGKKFLEAMIDAPVTTFVPPWNTYDLNTLRALKELGFSTISASLKGNAMKNSSLNFLPVTCHDLHQLRDAVSAARRSSDTQPVIVVLFHEYDFREVDESLGNITYQELSDLLSWLQSRGYVRLLSISQAIKEINDLSAKRFLLNNSIYNALNLLPFSFLRKSHDNRYADIANTAKCLWLCVGVFYLTIASLVAFAAFLVGCFLFPKSTFAMNIITYGGTVISIIILIYTFHRPNIYIKGMTVSAAAVGASFGTWLCLLYLKKKWLQDKTDQHEKSK